MSISFYQVDIKYSLLGTETTSIRLACGMSWLSGTFLMNDWCGRAQPFCGRYLPWAGGPVLCKKTSWARCGEASKPHSSVVCASAPASEWATGLETSENLHRALLPALPVPLRSGTRNWSWPQPEWSQKLSEPWLRAFLLCPRVCSSKWPCSKRSSWLLWSLEDQAPGESLPHLLQVKS